MKHECPKCGTELRLELQVMPQTLAVRTIQAQALTEENEPAYWSARLYARHPKTKGKVLVENWVCKQYMVYAPAAFVERLRIIDEVHALWCASEDWTKDNGHWARQLAEWLEDEGWTRKPKATEPVRKKSRVELEMEAI